MVETEQGRTPYAKEAGAEPIQGYRLIEPLGRGGFGEVWKCEAPGGIYKAIKFVYGNMDGLDADAASAEEELRAVQRIKSIRHPFLLSMDRVESVNGELVIVTELADQNLEDVLKHSQANGLPGIPRPDLLGYLREAAEVLDLLNHRFELQHLDVKPRNFFLVSNHVKVADFGLVNSLSGGKASQIQLGAITPLYAAPEVFTGSLSRHSDQYSLAIVFMELLTGKLPFPGKNVRQLLLQHTTTQPDLSPMRTADREVIGRALEKDPDKRFPSCTELIKALQPELSTTSPSSHGQIIAEIHASGNYDELEVTPVNGHVAPVPVVPTDVPGYRFLECQSTSPLGEQWKTQSAEGKSKLIKFVYGFGTGNGKPLPEVLARLKSLQHPGLMPVEVIQVQPGRLTLATDAVEETLRDRWHQCVSRKLPGIMRGELVDYLRSAAEVLDYLYQQHSVQHLMLSPRNLILDYGWLQIADFGIAQLLWLPAGQAVAKRNARYSAPELFQQHVSPSCDQFSLALIYCEMLTGVHPFRGSHGGQRNYGAPDLERLPPADRDVIARAFDPDPRKRWHSSTEMVLALEGSLNASDKGAPSKFEEKPDRFAALVAASRNAPASSHRGATQENLNDLIKDLVASIGGSVTAGQDEAPLLRDDVLHHRFTAGLPLGSARLKLDAFNQQWFGQLVRDDDQGSVFHINLPSNFWQSWIGRHPGLEVQVSLARVNPSSATPIEVRAKVSAFRCSKKRGQQLLEEMGPQILDSLRSHLLVNSEKRTHERLLWPHPLKVMPVNGDGVPGDPVACHGKDISLSGIGFYLPDELDTSEIIIQLPNTVHPPALSIPASLVRAKRTADGWYEVGALFRLPALRKNRAELALNGSK